MPAMFSVPAPCSQHWSAMTPTAAGRFCGNCQHEVVDFTALPVVEAQRIMQRAGGGCGRFQLGQVAPSRLVSRLESNWPKWLAATAIALSSCEAPNSPSDIQLRPAPIVTDATAFIVRGRVVHQETGRPLAGASVMALADTTLLATTGADGQFSLRLPAALRDSLLLITAAATEPGFFLRQRRPAQSEMMVRLRPMPDVIGQYTLQAHEIRPLTHEAPPPPPPKLTTVKFLPPQK